MKKIIVTLLTVVMVAGALMAFPRGYAKGMGNNGQGYNRGNMNMPMHHPPMRRDGKLRKLGRGSMMLRRIFSQLDLTDTQMDKLDKIRSKYKLQNIELRGKIKTLDFQKREAIKNHEYDNAKKIVGKVSDIRKTIAENRMDNIKELWNVLTDKQKEKADKLIKEQPYKMPYRFHDDDNDKDE